MMLVCFEFGVVGRHLVRVVYTTMYILYRALYGELATLTKKIIQF